ncbi:MAG: YhcH/YjgK/YiaL family protein [Planctomycetota bacterium]|jgi:biofilm protein TabA|nr:YhcH/YjgK/YiaL family protein [Planctomycetota bacterium]
MILDTLHHADRYVGLNPRFARAFEFLRRLGPDPAVGRHDIDGDLAYALVQTYPTRPAAGVELEAHRRYIDIQYLARGREVILWAPVADLEAALLYEASKDVEIFSRSADVIAVPVRAGQVMILYPDDAHAPCCHWGEPTHVLKVVIKVAVSES